MAAGRPRTVSLAPRDMEILGQEMIIWIKLNNPLHISEFYSTYKQILFNTWDTMIKRPEFVPYYEQAMLMIGKQYLDRNSNVREGASQRWQRVYFKDLALEEDTRAQRLVDKDTDAKIKVLNHMAAIKAKETETVSQDIKDQFDALMKQFKPDLA